MMDRDGILQIASAKTLRRGTERHTLYSTGILLGMSLIIFIYALLCFAHEHFFVLVGDGECSTHKATAFSVYKDRPNRKPIAMLDEKSACAHDRGLRCRIHDMR